MKSISFISVISFCSLSVLLVACNGSTSDTFVSHRQLAVSSTADLVALITRTDLDTPTSLTLTGDIILTAPLPLLPNFANITLKGACPGRRCIIDGQNKYPVFITKNVGCTLLLENVEFRNIRGGVLTGECVITVKNCLFQRCTSASNGGVFSLTGLRDEVSSGPGLVITGSTFFNNTAAGNGGAIFIVRDYSRASFTIFGSTFKGNVAGGNGGALAMSNDHVFLELINIRSVNFEGNIAGGSGGALSLPYQNYFCPIVEFFSVGFMKNTAKNGTGGAIDVDIAYSESPFAAKSQTGFLFCGVKFVANAAPTAPQTANISLVSSEPSPGTLVKFCGGRPLGTRILSTLSPSVIRVVSSCRGCSGCADDCKALGTCIVDPKGNGIGVCKCRGFREPSTSCGTCLTGYGGANCTSCSPGFTNTSTGQCAACEALTKIPELDTRYYLMSSVTRSLNTCQRTCKFFGTQCNKVAWFDPRSACPWSCILYGDPDVCFSARNATFSSQYRVYYLDYQRDRLFCDDK